MLSIRTRTGVLIGVAVIFTACLLKKTGSVKDCPRSGRMKLTTNEELSGEVLQSVLKDPHGEARSVRLKDDILYDMVMMTVNTTVNEAIKKGDTAMGNMTDMAALQEVPGSTNISSFMMNCLLNATGNGTDMDPICNDTATTSMYAAANASVEELRSCILQSYSVTLVAMLKLKYNLTVVNLNAFEQKIAIILKACQKVPKAREWQCLTNTLQKYNPEFTQDQQSVDAATTNMIGLMLMLRAEIQTCVVQSMIALDDKCDQLVNEVKNCQNQPNSTSTD